ncbi:ribose 1,5-bisphosphokinase [Roseibium hamelinense]|uniref:ribose 1,5-bisphosphate phosphokinase n=1 Tax=Roseibium hamelinense TaxID=150831 RepID=A0A562SMK4_9HYPH|nr:ribose 1,5-bisphosphokinase [Roseibium hamelinense]
MLVVGPSGAGKDTLLDGLRTRLSECEHVYFARRMITRAANAATENHGTLSEAEYDRLSGDGNIALCWRAHGLGYVLPAECDTKIRNGYTVIANGSRRALPKAFEKYLNPKVILITAPIPVLAARLAQRGRETRTEIEARLSQASLELEGIPGLIRIENTGTVDQGVNAILQALGYANG